MEVLDIDRNKFHMREFRHQVPDAGLEGTRLGLRATSAFGKNDERVTGTEHVAQRIERIGMICSTAVNKNASEFIDGNAAANGASAPVVFCRNRMNVSTQFRRQRCPDHNSVKMARMVGKVDALARRRRATLPVWVGADKKSRKPHNGRHQFKGAEHGKKSLYAGD